MPEHRKSHSRPQDKRFRHRRQVVGLDLDLSQTLPESLLELLDHLNSNWVGLQSLLQWMFVSRLP